jgi:hypothetical protein
VLNVFLEGLNLLPELSNFLGSTGWSTALFTFQEAAEQQETQQSSSEDGFQLDPPWSGLERHRRKLDSQFVAKPLTFQKTFS